jgi:rod shape-determining protein MreC
MDSVDAVPRRSFPIFLGSLILLMGVMSYQISDPVTGRSVLVSVGYRLFSPIQSTLAGIFTVVINGVQKYLYLTTTNQENQRLLHEISELKIQIRLADQIRHENDRLRRVLELKQRLPYHLIAGEVTARDAKASQSRTLMVNRGSRHGITSMMPVVTPEGIVGIAIYVDVISTKVLMITDAAASIGAMLERGRVAGILSGDGRNSCILKFLPISVQVKKGDLVVTSGQEGIFPEGLAVGRVLQEVNESSLYRSVEVVPFPNFTSVNEVLFLKKEGAGAK